MPDETRFEAVLAEILQAEEAGQPPDLTSWLDRHSDLAERLRAFFRDRSGFARLARDLAPTPLRNSPGEADTVDEFGRSFEKVCQTWAFAHGHGVIHRDLKSGNVMVGSFGEVQVMDWGLAKVLASRERQRPEDAPAENGPQPETVTHYGGHKPDGPGL